VIGAPAVAEQFGQRGRRVTGEPGMSSVTPANSPFAIAT